MEKMTLLLLGMVVVLEVAVVEVAHENILAYCSMLHTYIHTYIHIICMYVCTHEASHVHTYMLQYYMTLITC